MRFEYQRVESLPRLAWCARLARGASSMRVRHGPWVETRADRFFEGAWDGDFADGRFDAATAFTGSGCIARESEVVCVASMNACEWLFALRDGDELWISNSLVFALVEADDAPDLSYPCYYGDILGVFRAGVTRPERAWVPTRRGRRLFLHPCVSLRVSADLVITREPRREPAPPDRYEDYLHRLEDTLARVLSNAADERRSRRLRPVVAVSRGYDSPAVAVMASRAGVREAVTFTDVKGTGEADSGREIAERLGLRVTEYPHLAYRDLPGMPEAEASLCDWGWNAPYAAMEPQLTGALLLSGSHGDIVWRTSPVFPSLRHPTATTTGGGSMLELRLRAGYAHMAVPYVVSMDPRPLRRISLSAEMRPWSIGGDYDRPIPRRIVEQAGIPREGFGRSKSNAAHAPFRPLDAARPSHRDLLRFVDALPRDRAREWKHRLLWRAYRADEWASLGAERALRALGADVLLYPRVPARWRKPTTVASWAFHWGFEKIRDRYRVA
ncbi:MAG TPA: hypothetical protein VMS55_24705 [Myxococcota bacterium]|nr:hypothetical protein [Myxococcota bacterium]